MNGEDYEKILKDIKQTTQKIANDMFLQRKTAILSKLTELNVPLREDDTGMSLKKGRPKKDSSGAGSF
jgi:hypothetical protein